MIIWQDYRMGEYKSFQYGKRDYVDIKQLTSLKQSILDAIEHLFARKREIRPLFLEPALPMNDEWNISPYLGVLPIRWI